MGSQSRQSLDDGLDQEVYTRCLGRKVADLTELADDCEGNHPLLVCRLKARVETGAVLAASRGKFPPKTDHKTEIRPVLSRHLRRWVEKMKPLPRPDLRHQIEHAERGLDDRGDEEEARVA